MQRNDMRDEAFISLSRMSQEALEMKWKIIHDESSVIDTKQWEWEKFKRKAIVRNANCKE